MIYMSRAKPYHPDFDPKTRPLARACDKGDLATVRALAASGMPLNRISDRYYGYYPLHGAAEAGHDEIVRFLLEHGARVDQWTNAQYSNHRKTPLLLAAENNHFSTVRLLVEAGADVNSRTILHNTPLSWAIARHNQEMFHYFLERGASPDYGDFKLAVRRGNSYIVKWLLDKGFELDDEETEGDESHLAAAIAHKNPSMVRLLLDRGAEVNRATGAFAEPPLVHAARLGQREIIELLLNHGGDPNLGSIHGAYALHLAARRGDCEIAQLLIDKGAKLNQKESDGMTPLDWALAEKRKAILALLVGAGARVPQEDRRKVERLLGKGTPDRPQAKRVKRGIPSKKARIAHCE
jgi:ankyrin repeat protein